MKRVVFLIVFGLLGVVACGDESAPEVVEIGEEVTAVFFMVDQENSPVTPDELAQHDILFVGLHEANIKQVDESRRIRNIYLDSGVLGAIDETYFDKWSKEGRGFVLLNGRNSLLLSKVHGGSISDLRDQYYDTSKYVTYAHVQSVVSGNIATGSNGHDFIAREDFDFGLVVTLVEANHR